MPYSRSALQSSSWITLTSNITCNHSSLLYHKKIILNLFSFLLHCCLNVSFIKTFIQVIYLTLQLVKRYTWFLTFRVYIWLFTFTVHRIPPLFLLFPLKKHSTYITHDAFLPYYRISSVVPWDGRGLFSWRSQNLKCCIDVNFSWMLNGIFHDFWRY